VKLRDPPDGNSSGASSRSKCPLIVDEEAPSVVVENIDFQNPTFFEICRNGSRSTRQEALMDTPTPNHCPSCGTLLGRDVDGLTDGLCPRCLLADSLHSTIAGQPAASPPPPVAEVAAAFPDLEVVELIGRGGMGAVYKARQKSLDRPVALKLLPRSLAADTGFAKRFEAEAKALATLNHPNIVTVHEFGHRDDFYFLLMEFVDGPNLRSLLNDHRLSPDEALAIVPRVCEALEYAHRRNVVHCDIKPENLLLNTEGQIKIADFGISRILGQTGPDSEMAAGTPAYMAPEQLDNPQSVDTRADIYSLGVVFYEMLTGERPNHELTPPSGRNRSVDVRLDEIVLRALDANPKARWQSANELNGELQTFLNERLGEPKVKPPEKLPASSPKRAWVACALALTSLLLLIGVFFAHNHIAPVSAAEHQESIDRWFEHQVELSEIGAQYQALEAKPEKTPADMEAMDDLRETISEKGWVTLELYGALDGVRDPVLSRAGYKYGVLIGQILALAAFFLGRRHLSWLRGQKEPLPAFKAGLVGALFAPLFIVARILTAVLTYHSLLVNTLAFISALLLSVWVVRRVIAWTRNLRNTPPLGVVAVSATALIALAIAIPLTAAMHSYVSTLQGLLHESTDLNQSHQEYIQRMHDNSRVSETEKLETAKSRCQEYARKNQSSELLSNQPLKLRIPEGRDLAKSVIGSLLALAAAFFILKKSRTVRS
jgi:serine/threonine protein kinase